MSKDYIQESGDLYGRVSDRLVPYLRFERKKDGCHCRIPQEVFEEYKQQGYSMGDILENFADWYAKSNYDYRKQYHANIVARNEAERIRNEKTGLSDKEIVEGYLAEWRNFIRRWRAKNEQIKASNSN